MRTDIAIIAYNRPRYLHVTLDSIFRCRHVGRYGVFLYVDGGPGSDQAGIKDVAGSWPLAGALYHAANLNNMHNIIFAMGDRFEDGAKEVLLLEEDYILRPDTLRYLQRCPRDAFFLSLMQAWDTEECRVDYSPRGNLLGREAFSELRHWIESRAYDGLDRPYAGGKLHASLTGHDAIFCAFLYATGRRSRFADRPYLATFGLAGRNAPAADAAFHELEARMFAGSRDLWLGNVVRILETNDYSNRFKLRLWPRDFSYGKSLPHWDGSRAAPWG